MTIPSAPIPATLTAALRYAIAVAMPVAVQRGWLGESDVANVSALILAGATVIYGLWKTHDRQTRLNNSAPIGRSVIR